MEKQFTLVEFASLFNHGEIKDEDFNSEAQKLHLYEPKVNKQNPDKTVWTKNDNNSWDDVRTKLVDTNEMSLFKYNKFYYKVKYARSL